MAHWIDALFSHHARHLPYHRFELCCPFLIGNLNVALVEYEATHLLFVGCVETFEEGFGIGELSFGDVCEDAFRLEDFGKVGFSSLAVVDDFVAVACDFEAMASAGETYDRYIG